MNNRIFSYPLKTIAIITGIAVLLLSVGLYAANQLRQGYRSEQGTSHKVFLHTGTVSFNSDKIEERGDCKVVTQNTCGKDVFIPTKTEVERNAFKNFATGSACIKLANCSSSCVLKEFINGVYGGTIEHSKMRNALATFINDEGTGTAGYGNFVLGYGIDMLIGPKTGYDGRPKIVSKNSIVADGIGIYSGLSLYEFELYGITPQTENTNRGCFADGSYWVNSNIYSRQILLFNEDDLHLGQGNFSGSFTTSRFGGVVGVDFGLVFGGGYGDSAFGNRFFGCRSELLPNPDKYCVERVVPQTGTSADKPTAIYLKEFTNNASFSYAGCHGSGNNCIPRRNTICTDLTGIANTTFTAFSTGSVVSILPMITPSGLTNNTGFVYKNTTGTNSYGSQIFGFYRYSNPTYFPFVTVDDADGTHSFAISAYSDDEYYHYNEFEDYHGSHGGMGWRGHRSWFGYNTHWNELYGQYGRITPLQDANNIIYNDNVFKSFPGLDTRSSLSGYFTDTITKYVCVAHTCGPHYTKTEAGCICNSPLCNIITPGGAVDD